MADPRQAFTNNPYEKAKVELTYTRVSDPIGGEPTEHVEREGEEFAKGHYEQLNAAAGTIAVGDQEWQVNGFGLRDHSWGPRTWQAPWYYRWLTANFGGDFGFMGSRIARPDRDGMRGGFIWDGERIIPCHSFDISTEWTDDRHLPPGHRGHAAPAEGSLKVDRQGPEPHPPAQPAGRPGHPHLRGPHRVDPRGRPGGLRPVGVPRPDHRRPARRPGRVAVQAAGRPAGRGCRAGGCPRGRRGRGGARDRAPCPPG